VYNKILNAEVKGNKYFVDKVETQLREKTTPGQPNPGYPLFKRKC
jgi:hypothetical protein